MVKTGSLAQGRSATRGMYKLSPNEEARLIQEDKEKRRKDRIVQVREQAKYSAANIRQDVKDEKQRQISKLVNKVEKELNSVQAEKVREMQRTYDDSVRTIGEGHLTADKQALVETQRQAMTEFHEERSSCRGEAAWDKFQHDKCVKHTEDNRIIAARSHALNTERQRAAYMASLPAPPPDPLDEIIPDKPVRRVGVTDANAFSTTHYHLRDDKLVTKASPSQQRGSDAASEELLRRDEETKAKNRLHEERKERARVRHIVAREKELFKNNYDAMLHDISDLQREDKTRRQRVINKIPKQVFLPPHKRLADRDDNKRDLEIQFEDLYMKATDQAGDLTLALDTQPETPTPTVDLDLSMQDTPTKSDQKPDQSDVKTVESKSVDSASKTTTVLSDIARNKKTDGVLVKLMDRIRNQRTEWTQESDDQSSPVGTSVSDKENKLPVVDVATEKANIPTTGPKESTNHATSQPDTRLISSEGSRDMSHESGSQMDVLRRQQREIMEKKKLLEARLMEMESRSPKEPKIFKSHSTKAAINGYSHGVLSNQFSTEKSLTHKNALSEHSGQTFQKSDESSKSTDISQIREYQKSLLDRQTENWKNYSDTRARMEERRQELLSKFPTMEIPKFGGMESPRQLVTSSLKRNVLGMPTLNDVVNTGKNVPVSHSVSGVDSVENNFVSAHDVVDESSFLTATSGVSSLLNTHELTNKSDLNDKKRGNSSDIVIVDKSLDLQSESTSESCRKTLSFSDDDDDGGGDDINIDENMYKAPFMNSESSSNDELFSALSKTNECIAKANKTLSQSSDTLSADVIPYHEVLDLKLAAAERSAYFNTRHKELEHRLRTVRDNHSKIDAGSGNFGISDNYIRTDMYKFGSHDAKTNLLTEENQRKKFSPATKEFLTSLKQSSVPDFESHNAIGKDSGFHQNTKDTIYSTRDTIYSTKDAIDSNKDTIYSTKDTIYSTKDTIYSNDEQNTRLIDDITESLRKSLENSQQVDALLSNQFNDDTDLISVSERGAQKWTEYQNMIKSGKDLIDFSPRSSNLSGQNEYERPPVNMSLFSMRSHIPHELSLIQERDSMGAARHSTQITAMRHSSISSDLSEGPLASMHDEDEYFENDATIPFINGLTIDNTSARHRSRSKSSMYDPSHVISTLKPSPDQSMYSALSDQIILDESNTSPGSNHFKGSSPESVSSAARRLFADLSVSHPRYVSANKGDLIHQTSMKSAGTASEHISDYPIGGSAKGISTSWQDATQKSWVSPMRVPLSNSFNRDLTRSPNRSVKHRQYESDVLTPRESDESCKNEKDRYEITHNNDKQSEFGNVRRSELITRVDVSPLKPVSQNDSESFHTLKSNSTTSGSIKSQSLDIQSENSAPSQYSMSGSRSAASGMSDDIVGLSKPSPLLISEAGSLSQFKSIDRSNKTDEVRIWSDILLEDVKNQSTGNVDHNTKLAPSDKYSDVSPTSGSVHLGITPAYHRHLETFSPATIRRENLLSASVDYQPYIHDDPINRAAPTTPKKSAYEPVFIGMSPSYRSYLSNSSPAKLREDDMRSSSVDYQPYLTSDPLDQMTSSVTLRKTPQSERVYIGVSPLYSSHKSSPRRPASEKKQGTPSSPFAERKNPANLKHQTPSSPFAERKNAANSKQQIPASPIAERKNTANFAEWKSPKIYKQQTPLSWENATNTQDHILSGKDEMKFSLNSHRGDYNGLKTSKTPSNVSPFSPQSSKFSPFTDSTSYYSLPKRNVVKSSEQFDKFSEYPEKSCHWEKVPRSESAKSVWTNRDNPVSVITKSFSDTKSPFRKGGSRPNSRNNTPSSVSRMPNKNTRLNSAVSRLYQKPLTPRSAPKMDWVSSLRSPSSTRPIHNKDIAPSSPSFDLGQYSAHLAKMSKHHMVDLLEKAHLDLEKADRKEAAALEMSYIAGISDEPDLTLVSLHSDMSIRDNMPNRTDDSSDVQITTNIDDQTTEDDNLSESLVSFMLHEVSVMKRRSEAGNHVSPKLASKQTVSLQDAFLAKKSQFVKNSEKRAASVKDAAPKLATTVVAWKRNRSIKGVVSTKAARRSIATPTRDKDKSARKRQEKDNKDRNNRLYNQLEEVKQQNLVKDRQKQYAENREKARLYHNKLQEKRKKLQQTSKKTSKNV